MNYEKEYNDSLYRLRSYEEEFLETFYDDFIDSSAIVKELFAKLDMTQQKHMLFSAFFQMRDFFFSKETGLFMERMAEIHSHKNLGFDIDVFDVWIESLIKSLKVHDPHFTEDTEVSWRLVMAPSISYLKFMHYK